MHFAHRSYCYLEFKLSYIKNFKSFLIRIKKNWSSIKKNIKKKKKKPTGFCSF